MLGTEFKNQENGLNHTRVKQGQREHFSDFLQRLTMAVQIGVADPDARRVLIESLAFENAN